MTSTPLLLAAAFSATITLLLLPSIALAADLPPSSAVDSNSVRPLRRSAKSIDDVGIPGPQQPYFYLRQPLSAYEDQSGRYSGQIPLTGVYDPFSLVQLGPNGQMAVVPLSGRSRRNSVPHGSYMRSRPREVYAKQQLQYQQDFNHVRGGPRPQRQSSGSGRYGVGVNPNQFLTRSQIEASHGYNQGGGMYNPNRDRKRDSVYYSRYHHNDQHRNTIDGGPQHHEEPWSVQVGTQLKVNHDDRQKNPERFYVRDETGAQNFRRPAQYRSI